MLDKKLLKKILITSKKRVFGDLQGNHPSIFDGDGLDFSELREYVMGDDIRKIHWATTAKQGTPYIKIFKEERDLNIVLISLLSGSMNFGSQKLKSEILAETISLLGFASLYNRDTLSSLIFTGKAYSITKPTKKTSVVSKIVENILCFDSLGQGVDFEELSKYINGIKKRSVVFLLGDFSSNIDLGAISSKHEIVSIIIRDTLEENPKLLANTSTVDPISLKQNQNVLSNIKEYRKKIQEHDKNLMSKFRKKGIRFIKIYTHEDIMGKLREL